MHGHLNVKLRNISNFMKINPMNRGKLRGKIRKEDMCRYQSITQQYLKRCLVKDDSNYMFRPIAAIIRFSSESMVIVLYRIGMGSHGGEISSSVMFVICHC